MESVKTAQSIKNIQTSSSTFNVLDVGGGDGRRAKETFPRATVTTIDRKSGWDIDKMGIPYGDWDLIFANHVMEHLRDPDFFLEECHKVMTQKTVLEIGMPNLTAWFNRILFLFGYVPHSMELSKRINIGRAFDWNDEPLGGHIFIYSLPALLQLLKYYGFKVISVEGEASTYRCNPIIRWVDRWLTKLNPNFASAVRVRCQCTIS